MQRKLSIVLDVIIEKGSSWLNSTGCVYLKPSLYRSDDREREGERELLI